MTTDALSALEALVAQFEAVLVQEESALRERDLDAVRTLAAEKASLLGHLEACLAGLSEPADDDKTRQTRAALHERLAACQHRNRINGALIEANRSFNALLLDVLRGESTGTRTQVYGRHGGLTELRGAGTIARA
jgi:flagellar biosynthesis/type III secretory pathway chaperone